MARQQMKEIRALQHTSVRNVDWTKPLTDAGRSSCPAMMVVMFVVMMWK